MVSAMWLVGGLSLAEIVVVLFALFGALIFLLFGYFYVTEELLSRGDREFGFDAKPVDRGTPILDYANEEVLRSIASHHNLEGPPAKVERARKRGVQGGSRFFRGSAEGSTTETLEPQDDLAELTRRLLGHLDKKGELNQTADCVHSTALDEPIPFLLDESAARQFFETWLTEHFPGGMHEVTQESLALELAAIGRQLPETKVRELVVQSFEALKAGSERLLFLEGEWSIKEEGDEGDLLLNRTDLRITTGNGEIGTHSLPMPSGISIAAPLAHSHLTAHGRTRMQGVTQPIRASVIATRRQYHPETGCFEVVPIAVFQRIDEDD